MIKQPEEWFGQADYDLETAEILFKNKRYVYTIFMCHLSIEKALKGIYTKRFNEAPPKIHNLTYFIEKTGLNPPEDLSNFIFSLNRAGVTTRYPDDLKKMDKEYNTKKTKIILSKAEEVLAWLKEKL
jgi:HEPN domain-containing protein